MPYPGAGFDVGCPVIREALNVSLRTRLYQKKHRKRAIQAHETRQSRGRFILACDWIKSQARSLSEN